MDDCIFCKIIRQEIPSLKVFEDEHAYAFLDINPYQRGHTLVVPKFHAKEIFNLPPEELAGMMPAIQRTACLLKRKLGCDGMVIQQLNGPIAGQTVFHVHFHLVPCYNDTPVTWQPLDPKPTMEELKALAELIRS
jgi:histidine triad (HIT) family protein